MPSKDFIIVAIDGGAAAGKSSTSRALSSRFNMLHVDTGSHYRSVTLKLLEAGIEARSGEELETGLEQLELGTRVDGNSASIVINDWTPDQSIRSQRVNDAVSRYAALPEVRAFLMRYQRHQAEVARSFGFVGLVMEGRDIGSVIFPDADLRLFLHADPAKRAQRRAAEGIVDSIEQRDKIDSSRKNAPLACPEGAVSLDTSEMTLEEVVDHVAKLAQDAYHR